VAGRIRRMAMTARPPPRQSSTCSKLFAYHRYKEDVALMKDTGANYVRPDEELTR